MNKIKPTKTIKLSCFNMEVQLFPCTHKGAKKGEMDGSIKSDLVEPHGEKDDLDAAYDAIESLVLACACEGIDISTPAFECAIETAVDAVTNHLS